MALRTWEIELRPCQAWFIRSDYIWTSAMCQIFVPNKHRFLLRKYKIIFLLHIIPRRWNIASAINLEDKYIQIALIQNLLASPGHLYIVGNWVGEMAFTESILVSTRIKHIHTCKFWSITLSKGTVTACCIFQPMEPKLEIYIWTWSTYVRVSVYLIITEQVLTISWQTPCLPVIQEAYGLFSWLITV